MLLCKAGVQLEGNYLICKKFVLEQNLAIFFYCQILRYVVYVLCAGLEVCQAFPCRCDETDSEQCSATERKVGDNVLHYQYCFPSLLSPDPPSFSMLHTKAGMALLSPRLYLSLLIFACDRSLLADSEVDAGQGLSGGWLVPQPPCLRGQALSE